MSPIDYDSLTQEEMQAAIAEMQRRQRAQDAATRAAEDIDRALRQRLTDEGREQGAPWVQPIDAMCAYPRNWEVTHGGKQWVATSSGVLGEPGVSESWAEQNNPEPEDISGEQTVNPVKDGAGEGIADAA